MDYPPLEGRFQQILANAAHFNGVPGRKSDTNDAAWIADLLAHGSDPGELCAPQPIQELRDVTRTRKQLTREIVQHTQRNRRRSLRASVPVAACLSFLQRLHPFTPRSQELHLSAMAYCERLAVPLRNRQLLLGGAPAHTSRSTDHWSAQAQELVGLGPPIGYPSPTTPEAPSVSPITSRGRLNHRDDPYALECRPLPAPSPATHDDTSASPRCIERLCHRRAHGGLFATGEGWRSIYAGGGGR